MSQSTDADAGLVDLKLGPLPKTEYTLASGFAISWMPGYNAEHLRAYAVQERAAQLDRLGKALELLRELWRHQDHADWSEGFVEQVEEALKA